MKKALSIAILFVMLVAIIGTGVQAAEETLADKVYAKLKDYGATSADKVRLENYLKDVSEDDADDILAYVDDAIDVMKAEGKTNVNELSPAGKDKVVGFAKDAATKANLKLSVNNGKIELRDANDKLLESAKISDSGKLAYTGNNNVVLVVSALAVFALATVVVAKVKSAKVGA